MSISKFISTAVILLLSSILFLNEKSFAQGNDPVLDNLLNMEGELIISESGQTMEGNFLSLKQLGSNNQVNLLQNGLENSSIVWQIGNGNNYNLQINGDNNYSFLLQKGDDNLVLLHGLEGNGLKRYIVQEGNGHELEISGGNDVPEMEVRQKGENGMQVQIIQKNRYQ
ncbi:hypothetical protein [Xanthovirga aplysinae]|uniref:hypothetical protein n=1 Tax=Xanthovirga aplysinae TaxID=2529853 RepID=UPI0012BBC831|nr:hypothetical protein [Xanthovirga aplysinae]MTI31262.1 hypothetical protein [Xanthovirga aplysinae]